MKTTSKPLDIQLSIGTDWDLGPLITSNLKDAMEAAKIGDVLTVTAPYAARTRTLRLLVTEAEDEVRP